MISIASAASRGSDPQVMLLNKAKLPELDGRLAFLSYITHGKNGAVNVEASASIKFNSCWSVLRFSALKNKLGMKH